MLMIMIYINYYIIYSVIYDKIPRLPSKKVKMNSGGQNIKTKFTLIKISVTV